MAVPTSSPLTTETTLSATQRWLVLLSIGIGTFMSALDGSVVNTILPVVRESFHSDVAAIEWVIAVYLLLVSGLLLTFGRLGDLYGHRRVYLSGFGIFILGSALCGLAASALALVAFRGVQALGAAMLLSNSPAILTKSFPGTQRGRALGLQATMTYLGLTVGPALGGWLAHTYTWRSVFYINVPVGALAFLLSLRFLPHDRPAEAREQFDLAGAVLFMAGLVSLLLGLNQGHAWGWTSLPILALLAGALVLLGAFVALELRTPAPMLDLSLFRGRVFSAAVGSAVLNYIALYSILFLLPFYLIQGRGLNSAQAGLVLTAQPLVMAICAPISGALSDRIGSRLLATFGMLFLAVGLFILSRSGPQTAWSSISLGLAVAGLGNGTFISPNSSALMGSAPRHRQGIAAGILATSRNVGMVLGIGLAGAILTTVLSHQTGENIFPAVQTGLLAASGVALLSSLVSALRGSEN